MAADLFFFHVLPEFILFTALPLVLAGLMIFFGVVCLKIAWIVYRCPNDIWEENRAKLKRGERLTDDDLKRVLNSKRW